MREENKTQNGRSNSVEKLSAALAHQIAKVHDPPTQTPTVTAGGDASPKAKHEGKGVQEEASSDQVQLRNPHLKALVRNPKRFTAPPGIKVMNLEEVEEGDTSRKNSVENQTSSQTASPKSPDYFSIAENWDYIVSLLAEFLEQRPSREELEKRLKIGDYSSSEEDSSCSSDEEEKQPLTLEEQLAKEKERTKRANETIYNLLSQINQYKQILEEEKLMLQNELKEEREEKLRLYQKLKKKADKLNEAFQIELIEYDNRLREMEEEKQKRNKEHISNLQTLLKELQFIEEKNELLSKEVEEYKAIKNAQTEELDTAKKLIAQQNEKIKTLEEEISKMNKLKASEQKRSTLVRGASLANLTTLTPEDSAKSTSAPSSPRRSSSSSSTDNEEVHKLTAELAQVHELHTKALQELEMERSKVQKITSLVTQIRHITSPETAMFDELHESGQDHTALVQKLVNEQVAHNATTAQLEELKKKAESDRVTIEQLNQRVKDLVKAHNSTLDQLEELKNKNQQNLESPESVPIPMSPKASTLATKRLSLDASSSESSPAIPPLRSLIGTATISKATGLNWGELIRKHSVSEEDFIRSHQKKDLMDSPSARLLPPNWSIVIEKDGSIQYVNKVTGESSKIHPLFLKPKQQPAPKQQEPEPKKTHTHKHKHKKKEKKEKEDKKEKKEKKAKDAPKSPLVPRLDVQGRTRSSSDQKLDIQGPLTDRSDAQAALKRMASSIDIMPKNPVNNQSTGSSEMEKPKVVFNSLPSTPEERARQVREHKERSQKDHRKDRRSMVILPNFATKALSDTSMTSTGAKEEKKRKKNMGRSYSSDTASLGSSHSSESENSPQITPREEHEKKEGKTTKERKWGFFAKKEVRQELKKVNAVLP